MLSIKYAVVSFVLTLAITVLSLKINDKNSDTITSIIGLLGFTIIILSIIGLIISFKSFHEPKKFQVFFSFFVNSFFIAFYLYLIITNS